jgi:hypothetical protein
LRYFRRRTPNNSCGRATSLRLIAGSPPALGRHRGPAHLHHTPGINLLVASLVIASKGRSPIATSYECGAGVAHDRCLRAPSICSSRCGERLGSRAPERPLLICLAGAISCSCRACLLTPDRRHFMRC